MYIGNKMKALREARKMSLTDLSQKSGVQMATLSRIENLKMVGTLDSHINIAKALGIDVTELYKDIGKQPKIAEFNKPDNRSDVFTHSEHSSYEILTKNVLQKKMMPVLIRIDSRGRTNREQSQANADKFVFVLEGNIEVAVGDQKFPLSKNHTLYFDASLPHAFINKGKTAAKVLCVGTPVSL